MKFPHFSSKAHHLTLEAELPTDCNPVPRSNGLSPRGIGAKNEAGNSLPACAERRAGPDPYLTMDDVAPVLALRQDEGADPLVAALRRLGEAMASCSLSLGDDRPAVAEETEAAEDLTCYQDSGLTFSDGKISFELLLEAAAVPIVYKNLEGVHLGCNRAFESFFGVTKQQLAGKTIFDIVPRHLAEHVSAHDELLVKEGGIQRYEARVAKADGAFRDVFLSKALFTNNRGEPAGLISVMVDITERKQAEQRLKEALEFAEGIISAVPDTLFEVDRDGRYLEVWVKDPDLLAQQRALLLGKTVNDVLPPDQAAIAVEALREADENGVAYGKCLRIPLPNGETRWFELSVAKKPGTDSSARTFLALSRDITERKRADDAFSKLRTHLISVLQTIPDMVWLKDAEGAYLLCNHAFERLTGKTESDVVGKTDFELFDIELAKSFREKDQAAIEAGQILINEEWVASADNGQAVLLETRKVPVFGAEGGITGILGVARDITELNASRQKIHQMAFYDSLTSLPNRALFHDRLRQMITDSAESGQLAAVMLIDIDHFKAVNDAMGHPVGDELLCQAALRLNAGVRHCDTVARLGGDEFAILLPNIRHSDELSQIASRILETFSDRFLLDGKEVHISCSIGIALYPDDSIYANDLVKFADSAMYLAKRSGRSSFRFYSTDLTASAQQRLTLEMELRRAIERGELELYFQPKVLLRSGMMIGSEALLRWRHAELGLVPPSQFIPIAEETGLIANLGRWVLREACQTAADLNAGDKPLHKVAINLSAREFQCQDLTRTVADVLGETSCRPGWIELEITESLLLDEKNRTLETLSALRAMGITIAIDDFGTGYSALSYLTRFPIDTLKIDRSFINSVDKRSAELVKAILSIARCLGQSVVAEGVETADQAVFLMANGCDAAQGFLYSKPLPKIEILRLPRYFREISLVADTVQTAPDTGIHPSLADDEGLPFVRSGRWSNSANFS
ncbi:PAS domain S-box-containing protein/diguanylate cyclase (GGDEF) domain-containing protein [Rhizobium mongolense subsp. loessense]|uniref:PAS domain S-box-containing protein/diguanylate cyclase (GGDEF) domain-containing protein n=1 Tax=Rhizobium mongolense subsp. loessense TaxID=158890 RepID=A0A1G4U5S0_9HYPH|nr:EAL domain-containing protein [Rhizobium mongolense]SCW88988.1 PAS domain S-box-containing protein/diguanylate cyclase (GGDEF) domain-containing protein [Rhizobium mongolense subsp. loessense]